MTAIFNKSPAMKTNGHVDLLTEGEIAGWTEGAEVEVLINDKHVTTIAAAGVRDDCVAAGFRNARGFYARTTRFLCNGENHIVVRDAETKSVLDNGETTIDFDHEQRVDSRWSEQYSKTRNLTSRWWQSEQIVRHVNMKVCGEPLPDLLEGVRRWVKQDYASRLPLKKGVSVGCGTGVSELKMIETGIVEAFDLFEFSSHAVTVGRAQAEAAGLGHAMSFVNGDAFAACTRPGEYDLVHWQQALHHMPDVDAALAWSRDMLRPGGLLVMFDYVGATRFQFSQHALDVNSAFRLSLDRKYLVNPGAPDQYLDRIVTRIDVDALIEYDPSEAMDSGRILPCLRKHFANADVRLIGGSVYHCGLSDVLHNLVEDGREDEIARALVLDDLLMKSGETHYAVAIAVR